MKRFWFKRKRYGWGWRPATWEGWLVDFSYVILLVCIFSYIDRYSHSASDTLIGVIVPMLSLTIVFILITWLTGERLRWQWGKRVEDAVDVLLRGKVAVVPTDTTYGIVGLALCERVVHEIYRLRKRDLNKPFIILISNRKQLKKFGVVPTVEQDVILDSVWPGPVSVIFSCRSERFAYLHRGKETLAFRCPLESEFRSLLQKTGPLVAPSANPEGLSVAKNISEAKAYFGHQVDYYQDGGTITSLPSKLVDITDGTQKILRI